MENSFTKPKSGIKEIMEGPKIRLSCIKNIRWDEKNGKWIKR